MEKSTQRAVREAGESAQAAAPGNVAVPGDAEAPCEAEEREHLAEVLTQAQLARDVACALAASTDASYDEVARHLVEVRGEMDGHEMKLNKLELIRMGRQAELAGQSAERIAKVLESPYFARVDFADDGTAEPMPSYIGRFAFTWDGKPVVSDWRSPIAGLFYDFDPGPASFDTPSGRRSGTLALKRQFRIEGGRLVYALDSDSASRDEVLARELSRATEPHMRTIVASIQREQNAIIRDEEGGTLIIQGVAGSGKTSIALHHIAYLLYRQKDTLASRNVAIISPSRVFSDYIGTVLPELGEEPVLQWSMEGLARTLLEPLAAVEPPPRFDGAEGQDRRARARAKETEGFATDLLAFLDGSLAAEGARGLFAGTDLPVGAFTAEAGWLDDRFRSYAPVPVNERLELMAEDILREAQGALRGFGGVELPTRRQVEHQLRRRLVSKNPLALYKRFLKQTGRAALLHLPAKGTVEWEDAYPLVLCRLAFDGRDDLPQVADVRHLVIDEMQDLAYVQHAAIARLFPGDKTILGDVNQLVDGRESVDARAVRRFYPASRFFALMRSYRSSFEISRLAQKVKPVEGLEVVERHGDEPLFRRCGDTRGTLQAVAEAIDVFRRSGHRSLGIICKTDMLAERYGELLAMDGPVAVITDETDEFPGGIVATSVRLAKGLEFDEVVLLDADSSLYRTEADRNLLYVAITRALHRLTVLYRVEPSPFLGF